MLARFDTTVPHPARVYDAWLGGKDNFAADRAAAQSGQQAFPAVVESVRANRAFLARAVEYLAAEAGIRQFLDIGTGLPSADNTHEVAQAVAPESRVVYVDNDPIVLRHAEALLTGKTPGATAYIDADLRDPDKVLAGAARTLDFSQPVAIMLLAVLHFVSDEQDPYKIVNTLLDTVPAGSYLVVSHTAKDIRPEQVAPFIQILNRGLADKSVSRDRSEVARFFQGLELVEPGVVNISEWRPRPGTDAEPAILWGAVARKPRLPRGDPADRDFLGAGGHKPSGGIVERPLAGAAPARVHGAALPVPEPVIGPERPVKPHRMVHRGRPARARLAGMRQVHGGERADVGRVCQQGRVPQRQFPRVVPGPQPHGAVRARRGARFDGLRPLRGFDVESAPRVGAAAGADTGLARRTGWRGRAEPGWDGALVLTALTDGEPPERRVHGQPHRAVLVGGDLAQRPRLPLADGADGIPDRPPRVAGRDEIRVQRPGRLAVRHRGAGGEQRLRDHAAAERPPGRRPSAAGHPGECPVIDLGETQLPDKAAAGCGFAMGTGIVHSERRLATPPHHAKRRVAVTVRRCRARRCGGAAARP
jgi:hypothetical protein